MTLFLKFCSLLSVTAPTLGLSFASLTVFSNSFVSPFPLSVCFHFGSIFFPPPTPPAPPFLCCLSISIHSCGFSYHLGQDQPLQSHFPTSSMILRNLWNHPTGRTSCFSYLSACTHIISFVWNSHPTPSPFPPFLRWLSPSYPSKLNSGIIRKPLQALLFPCPS